MDWSKSLGFLRFCHHSFHHQQQQKQQQSLQQLYRIICSHRFSTLQKLTKLNWNHSLRSFPYYQNYKHYCPVLYYSTKEDRSNTNTTKNNIMSSSSLEKEENKDDGEFVSYSPKKLKEMGAIYGMCISAVVPRPIGLITSLDKTGKHVNCAPFSYTGLMAHDPPMISHGLCLSRNEKKKDTLVNIEDTKEWIAHIISDDFLKEANETAAAVPANVNELELAKLDTNLLPSVHSNIPRIGQAKVAMECKLEHSYPVYNDDGVHTTTIVIGRVVQFHIHKSVLDSPDEKPKVNLEALRPVGRVGGITYWPVGDGKAVSMKRP